MSNVSCCGTLALSEGICGIGSVTLGELPINGVAMLSVVSWKLVGFASWIKTLATMIPINSRATVSVKI
jgi:hypothetical protein